MTETHAWYTPFDNSLKSIKVMIRSQLWAQIILALILGIVVGLMLSPQGGGLLEKETAGIVAEWVKLPGSVFLAMIQMVVMPLVVSSIMLGVATAGDPDYLKRIGLRIFPYFVLTTCVAVTIGAALAIWIEPGRFIDGSLLSSVNQTAAPATEALNISLPERLVSLFPKSMTQAAVDQSMLQLVVYSIIMGVALIALPKQKAKLMLQVLDSVQSITMKVVSWAMMLAPYAVFGLLCDITIKIGLDALLGMSVYVLTVLLGLVILLCFYLLIVKFLAGRSPIQFLKEIRSVQLLAFSTSSSAAVMPLSLKTSEENLKVNPSIGQFVVPLGATINMDGTALYQTIAAIFLVQAFGIELSTSAMILLMLTTVGASIGAPSTPGVGIVILASLLESVGVPGAGIALILGVDRILDMSRTTLNVSGDMTACCVMDKWLPASDAQKPMDYWSS
ncbi:dicarboxylate/amino acid:cation symporter [Litoribrevibacter albus]|uniref:Dicarboxylate/amino acid:cation symporter n=1 Tax=Litoribrevibacter albus TaxID=1473156 RepID=A0AA37W708_9GAMM|nr:dicarboxylate/amino acid:cation symporter [Litoribrevibacter albus]GLQ30793.1 dicarboxylate/amino acid:cation symporter [Litoribrevibacter albus]